MNELIIAYLKIPFISGTSHNVNYFLPESGFEIEFVNYPKWMFCDWGDKIPFMENLNQPGGPQEGSFRVLEDGNPREIVVINYLPIDSYLEMLNSNLEPPRVIEAFTNHRNNFRMLFGSPNFIFTDGRLVHIEDSPLAPRYFYLEKPAPSYVGWKTATPIPQSRSLFYLRTRLRAPELRSLAQEASPRLQFFCRSRKYL